MGVLRASHPFTDCREGEVLQLRRWVEGQGGDLPPGYYVLREVLSFRDDAGVSFAVVSQVGEDEDGQLVVDGETHILPRHVLEEFVGTGLRAREPFIKP
ncbi:MAG: hypothetical protein V4671_06410 [Armatimonadota bacterium]